jgi:hypothetical protein
MSHRPRRGAFRLLRPRQLRPDIRLPNIGFAQGERDLLHIAAAKLTGARRVLMANSQLGMEYRMPRRRGGFTAASYGRKSQAG